MLPRGFPSSVPPTSCQIPLQPLLKLAPLPGSPSSPAPMGLFLCSFFSGHLSRCRWPLLHNYSSALAYPGLSAPLIIPILQDSVGSSKLEGKFLGHFLLHFSSF